MPRRLIILVVLVTIIIAACKKKPKKSIEQLSTKVETFQENTYLKSHLDSQTISKIKAFGTEIDSAVFQSEIQEISKIVNADPNAETYHTNSGVAYTIDKYGGGEYPLKGDVLLVHVETTTLDGKKIFSSKDLKQPLQFVLGVGQVVPAWDEVFLNVQEGTTFQIISPSAMSYGKKGFIKSVDANTILKYDITFEKIIEQKNPSSSTAPKLKVKEDSLSKNQNSKIPVTLRKPQ